MSTNRPRSVLRGGAIAALALAPATCAPPQQNGSVVVSSGAAERLWLLCQWRRDGGGPDGLCQGAESAPPPARIRRITSAEGALTGPLAAGRPGDLVLENDEIAVVIEQLGPGTGLAEGGGNLIDAADARARRDELGQIIPRVGAPPRQARYDELTSGSEQDGTAWIEVRGRATGDEALSITTRYALRPRDRAVLLTTSVRNDGPRPTEALDLGDVVAWGATEPIAPGRTPGFHGAYEGAYLAGVGDGVAYALAPADGAPIRSISGAGYSDVSFVQGAVLPPGGRVAYQRVLAVAPRGDPLGVATELLVLGGGAPGGVALELVDARGARLSPVAGRATLTPIAEGAAPGAGALALWLKTGAAGPLGAEAPPGRYLVGFEGSGRRALSSVEVAVRAGEIAPVRLALSDAGRLTLSVREHDAAAGTSARERDAAAGTSARERDTAAGAALPGRPTPAKVVVFDAVTGKPASPPRLTLSGDLELPLPEGKYRVVASRGPEYSLAEATVAIEAGAAQRLELTLARVVDTSGYVACDLGQHTALSADSGVSATERIAGNVAEGIECAVSSEHDTVVDLAPTVTRLDQAARLRAIPGVELTARRSDSNIGSVTVFPLEAAEGAPRGGAPRWRDQTEAQLFQELRALPGERVIQVGLPRGERAGLHAFDAARSAPTMGLPSLFADLAEGARPDAVEVWIGRDAAGRDHALEELWALLRASRPVTPAATSDTHGLAGPEAGAPRTYVGVRDDDPGRLDPADLVAALRHRRDVVLTNGPFVTVQLGGARQGGLVSKGRAAGGARRTLSIRVERAPWVDARELEVLVGGKGGVPIPLSGARLTPAGALVDELAIPVVIGGAPQRRAAGAGASFAPAPLVLHEDTFLVVVVRGRRPLEPVVAGAPEDALPFAMTSPLWIDADGDGRALGRAAAP